MDVEYVHRVSGIRTRHWALEKEECSHFAEIAARQAISNAGLDTVDLEAILVSTTSPDMIFPSTACHLQRRLGIPNAAAFDLKASCSGFLYGLSMADCFIRSGQFRQCLVVAAEIKSRSLDSTDPETSILFGDGAGAAVVVREEKANTGILGLRLYSDGGYHDLVKIPAGGSRLPTSPQTIERKMHSIHLRGTSLFRIAVKRLGSAVKEILEAEQVSLHEIRQVLFHQANSRILKTLARQLGISQEQSFSIIEEIGNTSSASLPMTLDYAQRRGLIQSGDLILLGAFGGGLTWGTALIRWG